MKKAWYIDSIEPWGGRVFATYRTPDLSSKALDEGMSYFMAPPAFEAELVASRSTAMSAERMGFQVGLYLKQSEVAFPSLDAIRDFVRRTFVTNGPDATPTAAAGATEPPRDKGGEGQTLTLDEQPPSGRGPQHTLLSAFEEFHERSSKLEVGESVQWQGLGGPLAPHLPISDEKQTARELVLLLAQTAWWCLIDCYERVPEPADSRWVSWVAEARAFCRAIDRLDLWDALAHLIATNKLHAALPGNLAGVWSSSPNPEIAARRVVLWARYQAAVADRRNIQDFENSWRYIDWVVGYYQKHELVTPYEDLSLIRCPIPCDELNTANGGSPLSMRALLLRLISAPVLALKLPSRRQEQIVSLVVFGAAQMASQSIAKIIPSHPLVLSDSTPSSTYSPKLFSTLAPVLWRWIERNFPRHVLAPAVEALVAAGLRRPAVEKPPNPTTPASPTYSAPQKRQQRSAGA